MRFFLIIFAVAVLFPTAAWADTVDDYMDPITYLYVEHPAEAPVLDRIIWCESRWDPNAQNPHSTARGLAQFLTSTWMTTPEGQVGWSRFDPYASIDAAAWEYDRYGAWPWLASNACHHALY